MGAFSSLTPTPVPMQCSGSFACFGSHPSLANRTDATVEVVVARSQNYPNCSSKLCRWLGPCETRSLLQRRLSKNCKFGTAYQAPWSERDLNRDYAVQNSEAACCIGRDHSPLFRFLIWHLKATCIFQDFGTSHHAVAVLFVFEATLVLPVGLTPLLMLEWQGWNIVLPCDIHCAHVRPDL